MDVTKQALTLRQAEKMAHAIGGKKKYRNRYVVYSDDPDWEDLVARGLAEKTINQCEPNVMYSVSEAGMSLIEQFLTI